MRDPTGPYKTIVDHTDFERHKVSKIVGRERESLNDSDVTQAQIQSANTSVKIHP